MIVELYSDSCVSARHALVYEGGETYRVSEKSGVCRWNGSWWTSNLFPETVSRIEQAAFDAGLSYPVRGPLPKISEKHWA